MLFHVLLVEILEMKRKLCKRFCSKWLNYLVVNEKTGDVRVPFFAFLKRLKQLKIDRAPNRDQTAMDCDDSDIEDNSDLGDDSDDEQGQVSRIVDQARAEARLDSMEDLDRATEQIP